MFANDFPVINLVTQINRHAIVFLFGGWNNVPPLAWAWLILLNGPCGVAYGFAFLRLGILSAIAMHLGTDLVWHVAS